MHTKKNLQGFFLIQRYHILSIFISIYFNIE